MKMGFLDNLRLNKEASEAKQTMKDQMSFTAQQNREGVALRDDDTYNQVQRDRSDLIRWQQDFQQDIYKLKYNFLGLYLDSNGFWRKDDNIVPLCNHLFFEQIVEPTCNFYLGRSFTNSFLSEKKICDLLKRTFNNLATTLVKKHKQYGIKFNDFDDIIRELKTVVTPAAYRAINGSTKKIDSTMIKRIESHEEKGEEKKRGWFGVGG